MSSYFNDFVPPWAFPQPPTYGNFEQAPPMMAPQPFTGSYGNFEPAPPMRSPRPHPAFPGFPRPKFPQHPVDLGALLGGGMPGMRPPWEGHLNQDALREITGGGAGRSQGHPLIDLARQLVGDRKMPRHPEFRPVRRASETRGIDHEVLAQLRGGAGQQRFMRPGPGSRAY